jgi:hypothetical protein
MSLIPSESYSFPDHFTTTIVPSRQPDKVREVAPKARKEPMIVPLPNPSPGRAAAPQRIPSEVPIAPPNPALVRATAPPPRISNPTARKNEPAPILKSKPAAAARVPAMDPPRPAQNGNTTVSAPAASNVIHMTPVRRAPQPPQKIQPPVPPTKSRPAPVDTTSQADFFELFAPSADGTPAKRRREMKFRRFIAAESATLAVLLPLAVLGVLFHPANVGLRWILNIFTIASAIVAAVIPILFYAVVPTLPEIER